MRAASSSFATSKGTSNTKDIVVGRKEVFYYLSTTCTVNTKTVDKSRNQTTVTGREGLGTYLVTAGTATFNMRATMPTAHGKRQTKKKIRAESREQHHDTMIHHPQRLIWIGIKVLVSEVLYFDYHTNLNLSHE